MTNWDEYQPATPTEHYLKRIADALDARNATPVTLLKEPAAAEIPLPADFPGADALAAAGITTLEAVPQDGATLTAIKGIGPATANQILTWFKT